MNSLNCYFCQNILVQNKMAFMECSNCNKKHSNIIIVDFLYSATDQSIHYGYIVFFFNNKEYYLRLHFKDEMKLNCKINTTGLVTIYEQDVMTFDGFPYNPDNFQQLIDRMPTILTFK